MKHGEFWFLKYRDVEMVDGEIVPNTTETKFRSMPHRMPRNEASIYYTNKIRKYFGLNEKLGFDKIEHEFDYYEALRIKEMIL
jgi:hypothetical protein